MVSTIYREDLIAGVDEAGRGPLAGPVMAAAVILDPRSPIEGLTDSKQLTEKMREKLFEEIRERAIAWSVSRASVFEIEKLNILQASLLAMQRAVEGLKMVPDLALIDGNRSPALKCPARTIVGGDQLEPAISAASIVAKVIRDRFMQLLDKKYPQYGFAKHKGYGTKQHLEALRLHGATRAHRRLFGPVLSILRNGNQSANAVD